MNERIKELRKTLDLTQSEFAERIGSSQNTLANYEIGRRNPSSSVINNICKEFNVNEQWLRTGEGEMFIELDMDEELAAWSGSLLNPNLDNAFMKKFVHVLSRLSKEDWKLLERMAKMMAEENEKAEQ